MLSNSDTVRACPECGLVLHHCHHDGEDIHAVEMPADQAKSLRGAYAEQLRQELAMYEDTPNSSDLETLREMLTRAGIVYSEETSDDGRSQIEIVARTGPNNKGYLGFVTYADFNSDGQLIEWSVWE